MPYPRLASAARLGRLAFVWLCLVGTVGHASQQLDRATRWRDDLSLFAKTFSANQKDFARLYPASAFDGELARLSAQVDQRSDADITLDLMRLVATGHVSHTWILPPTPQMGFARLPVGF